MILFVPILLLLLTMCGLFIFYCCVSLSGKQRNANSKPESSACYCSVCVLFVFVTLTITVVGILGFSTLQLHSKQKNIVEDLHNLSHTENWIYDGNNSEQSFNKTQFFNNYLNDCSEGLNIFSTYSFYGFLSLGGVILFTSLISLFSVCCKSKCLLITATSVNFICLVVVYLCFTFELTLNVGIADYCQNPKRSLARFLVGSNLLDRKSAAYHIFCPSNNINSTYDNVLPATTNDCSDTSALFYDVITNLCEERAQPSLLLISSLFMLAIFITILSCASPITWRRFSKLKKKNMRYLDDVISEDDDVFLATDELLTSSRNRPSMTRTNNPMCIRDSTDDDLNTSPMLTSHARRHSIEFSPNTRGTFEPSAPPPPNADAGDVMLDEISASLVIDDVDEDGERPPPYSPPRPH